MTEEKTNTEIDQLKQLLFRCRKFVQIHYDQEYHGVGPHSESNMLLRDLDEVLPK